MTTAVPATAPAASIAKFSDLMRTNVQEQLEISWDQFFDWIEQEPTEWVGQMEHGGWSPVRYNPPKRSKDNVREVFAIVLDYDKGGDRGKLVEIWQLYYGLIYTTKSHGASGTNGDRLRVILPLARTVDADEYSRVWEWAAELSKPAGCPADSQCKDASRFWYDPSMPPGGWWSQRLTGDVLDPAPILAAPPASKPALRVVPSPTSFTTDDRIKRARAYVARIPGAVSGDSGHTATFNAVAHCLIGFDLSQSDAMHVIANDYNPRCDPPWDEKALQHKIDSVAKLCKRERGYLLKDRPRITSGAQAAKFAPPIPDETSVDWWGELSKKADGSPKRAYRNVLTYVRLHPEYRGKWSFDTMTAQPWFNDERPVDDVLVHTVRANADKHGLFTPSREDVEAAILTASQERQFHPIQQYLRAVDWDGQPRLMSMARDYLGSDSKLHAEIVCRWMIGAAARALRPGCKLDTALMLVGPQGYFKSTFFAILGGAWHSDTFVDITNKDSFVQIHSAWIYELAELENVVTGRAESRLKAWLTSTHDMYRAPYARTAVRKSRSVALCGTTNRKNFLTDDTGSRRFWIVEVRAPIDKSQLADARDQLWAEAVNAVESGERWWLENDIEVEREIANREFEDEDPWADTIESYLASPRVDEATVSDLLRDALKVDVAKQDRWSQMRVSRIMAGLGWARKRSSSTSRARVWKRPGILFG
jgi:hypothetical protein